MIPVVAQTVAFFGERPSANAFGMRVSATATFGFGRSACTHSRSIIACSSGACCGVTSRAPMAAQGELVGARRAGTSARPPAMTATVHAVGAGGEQRDDERDVDAAEQEDETAIRTWRPVSLPNEVGRGISDQDPGSDP